MASVETLFLVNFILNITIAVTGIIVALLIPSTRKIREHRAGTSMGSKWIPFVLVLMAVISIAVFPITLVFLEGDNMIFGLVLDIIAILVTIFAVREFFAAKKAYRETFDGDVEEVDLAAVPPRIPQQHPYRQNAPAQEASTYSQQPVQGSTYTVECPGCGNHIQVAEGSNTITCPFCGISGTI